MAQKTQAERDAKRVLHEAGVAKKKEIIAKSIAIKSEQQVNLIGYIKNKVFKYLCFQTHLEEIQRDLQKIENELKVKEGLWKKKKNSIDYFLY